jgi:hypothetical protein
MLTTATVEVIFLPFGHSRDVTAGAFVHALFYQLHSQSELQSSMERLQPLNKQEGLRSAPFPVSTPAGSKVTA